MQGNIFARTCAYITDCKQISRSLAIGDKCHVLPMRRLKKPRGPLCQRYRALWSKSRMRYYIVLSGTGGRQLNEPPTPEQYPFSMPAFSPPRTYTLPLFHLLSFCLTLPPRSKARRESCSTRVFYDRHAGMEPRIQ